MDSRSFVSLFFVLILGASTVETAAEHVDYVCENETARISCPNGKVIRLLVANYGRFAQHICNDGGVTFQNTMCAYDGTLARLIPICDSKFTCVVTASNDFFADPCRKINKYLEVQYICVDGAAVTTTTTTTAMTTFDPTTVRIANDGKIPLEDGRSTVIMDTPDVAVSSDRFCDSKMVRDILWPRTSTGRAAFMSCPQDIQGIFSLASNETVRFSGKLASWNCTKRAEWSSIGPDLSACSSEWIRRLRFRANYVDSEALSLELVRALRRTLGQHRLYGGDLILIGQIFDIVINRFGVLLRTMHDEDRFSYAKEMSKLVVDTTRGSLTREQASSWLDLTVDQRRSQAFRLMKAVEKSAEVLGKAMKPGREVQQVSSTPHILLQVLFVHLHDYVRVSSSTVFVSTRPVDSLLIPIEALHSGRHNTVTSKLIFTSYGSTLTRFVSIPPDSDTDLPVRRRLVSRILSVNVIGDRFALFDVLPRPIIVTFVIRTRLPPGSVPVCVWWTGDSWSDRDCRLRAHNDTATVCSCSHLTRFALAIDTFRDHLSAPSDLFPFFLTYIGCSLAIALLAISFVAFQWFPSDDRLTVHKNICFCLLVAELIFLFGIWQTGRELLCSIVAGGLQFLFLAIFVWVLLEAFELYRSLTEVYERPTRRLYFYLLGYGLPVLVVSLSIWAGDSSFGTIRHCWLRSDDLFILSFVGPLLAIITVDLVFLIITLYVICRHESASYSTSCKYSGSTMAYARSVLTSISIVILVTTLRWCLKGAALFVLLLGLTWTSALFWIEGRTRVMAYIFTVLNLLQGVFIFVFHVLLNDGVHKQYRRWIGRSRFSSNSDHHQQQQHTNGRNYLPGLHSNNNFSSGTRERQLRPFGSNVDNSCPSNKMYQDDGVTDPGYNVTLQLLLARQGTVNSGPYEYATISYEEVDHLPGTMQTASPPPPSYPPPSLPPFRTPLWGGKPWSDDSAYSEGSSGSMPPTDRSVIRMDLSQNPPVFRFPSDHFRHI